MLINNENELLENLKTVETYLHSSNDDRNIMIRYIKRGRVFIAYKTKDDDNYHFAPSRFLGYKDNTLTKHANNNEKDGRDTDDVITEILNQKRCGNTELEKQFLSYCSKLNTIPDNHKKTFWVLNHTLE